MKTKLVFGLFMTLSLAAAAGCNDNGTPTTAAPPTAPPTQQPGTAPLIVTTATNSLGEFLTDSQNRSLYLFEADTPGKSNCNGACAEVWTPLLLTSGQPVTGTGDADSSKLTSITRDDGTSQVAYQNVPLYYYTGDTAAGQTNGEGLNQFGAEWYLVKPADGTKLEPSGS